MADKSKIDWTDATLNFISGCTPESAACKNCYARGTTEWLRGLGQEKYKEGFDKVVCHGGEKLMTQAMRWKRGRKIFVNSMSDTFHKDVPFEFIAALFGVMAACPQHTFQILTKRPERMLEWFKWLDDYREPGGGYPLHVDKCFDEAVAQGVPVRFKPRPFVWPLPNVWIGATVENQEMADRRIPFLLQAPAAKRFVSCEPLLGPISLNLATDCDCQCNEHQEAYCPGTVGKCCFQADLDQVIVGGESGPHARPMHPDWVRSLRDQCQQAKVSFFFKQWGEWAPYVDEDKFTHGDEETDKNVQSWINPDGETGVCWIYDDDGTVQNWTGNMREESCVINKFGKKRAGRELDGRIWEEMPNG